ncbi:hypothetical protein SAMN03159448_05010 [Sinorhizobium sp. NFACC03]|nr:hypothetical protein SAMN03159448_05010 [Sinorhizobium sp. NFACC03]
MEDMAGSGLAMSLECYVGERGPNLIKGEPLRSRGVKPLQQSFKLLVLQSQLFRELPSELPDLFIQSSNLLG